MSIFMCEQSSSCDRWCEVDVLANFSTLTTFSSGSPWWWGIWCAHVLLLFALCCIDPRLMIDVGSCYFMLSRFLASCYPESFIWCTFCHKYLWYAFRTLVACCWDTLDVIMHVFCFDILFVPCWRDAHHACFCITLIGVSFDWEF